MKLLRTLPIYLALSLSMFLWTTASVAQIFDNPQNLKVLPEDISPDELGATMRGFATNTGSRCSTCHVGKVEHDLSTYDFSLDDKEEKRKARHMIRMVADINAYLAENLGGPAADLVAVDCATCHRGRPRPEMLQDILRQSYDDGGLENADARYRELRERYYGDYAFDFSSKPLLILAEDLAADGDADGALQFLDLNLEFIPRSSRSLLMKAQIEAERGNKAEARENLLKAIELEPENQWLQQMLQRLDAS